MCDRRVVGVSLVAAELRNLPRYGFGCYQEAKDIDGRMFHLSQASLWYTDWH